MDYAQAVEAATVARNQIKRGVDPVAERQEALVAKRKQEYAKGAAVDKVYRLSAIAADWLLSSEARLKPSTINSYRASLDVHILPEFGSIDIRYFDYPVFEEFVYKLAVRHPSVPSKVLGTLRALFSYAVEKRLIDVNPLLGRKRLVKDTSLKPRTHILSDADIHDI